MRQESLMEHFRQQQQKLHLKLQLLRVPIFFSESFKKLCDLFFLSKPVRKSSCTASGCTKFKSIFIIGLQYTSGKAPQRCISPFSSISIAPSPAIEISTFTAPISLSLRAYFSISSSLVSVTPNISPSSWLLGLIRKGLYLSTLRSRSFVASTTVLIFLCASLSSIFS